MNSSKEVPFPASEYIPECHDRYTDIAAYDVPKYLNGLAGKYNMHFKMISSQETAMFNDKCCIIIGIDRRDGVILNMTFLENGRRTEYIMNGYLINKFDDPDRYSLFHDCVPTDENIRNQLTMVSRGLDSKWSDLLNGDMNWFEDFKKTSFYYELKVGLEYRNKILEEIIAWTASAEITFLNTIEDDMQRYFMNRFIKVLAGTVCAFTVLFTGVAVYAEDGRKTPSGAAYEDIGAKLDQWAADNPDEYVSFVTAAFDSDEILYEGAYGLVDRENNIAAQTDSVYEWGSISKLTIWVSAMQLYEQGKLDLNADIRTYLPEGFLQNLKYDEPITMLNLMNHNAGWGECTWNLQVDNKEDIVSLGEALKATEPPQIYRPGEVCSYSNWGAALAGYIVECISGQSYADYVRENIFEPLGMEHTAILPDHSDNAWVQQKRTELVHYDYYGSSWNSSGNELLFITIYPAGAVTGTIGDLAKFGQSFVREDHPLFAKKETLDLFISPSSYLGDTDIPNCCHGMWVDFYENCTLIGHDGGTNCCASDLKFDPETGFGYVFMTSSGGKSGVKETLFGATSTPDMSKYSGTVTKPGGIAGVYICCRSIRHGFFKLLGMFSMLPANYKGDNTYDAFGVATIRQLNDNVCTLEQSAVYPAYVYETSDGTTIFTLGSQSYAKDYTLVPSLVLFILYVIMSVAGIFMLIYKLVGLITRKLDRYQGLLLITITQVIRPAVVIPLVPLLSSYSHYYGVMKQQGYMVFGIEAACLAVFIATLVSSVIGLFSKSENAGPKWKYALSIVGNVIAIAMMVLLELVNIWKI